MNTRNTLSRRSLLAMAAAAPLVASAASKDKHIPVGLELYSVREDLQKDLIGTVRGVAKMGYEGVEFYSPYFGWTPDYAKQVRKLTDDLGIRVFSTHNGSESFQGDGIAKAIELNQIIGSKFIVLASAGRVDGLDGWRKVADMASAAAEKMRAAGLRAGYHNHQLEFKPIDGKRPIEILAANTPKDFMLQLDVGTCVEMHGDPVAWINANPGRINSLHLKDYSPDAGKGYKVLFGEGVSPWKEIFEAAEKNGGVEYYLIEQEGSSMPAMETADACLKSFHKIHG